MTIVRKTQTGSHDVVCACEYCQVTNKQASSVAQLSIVVCKMVVYTGVDGQ